MPHYMNSTEIAGQLIDMNKPLDYSDSLIVVAILGSLWKFSAGMAQLKPQKLFERSIPLLTYASRKAFENVYEYRRYGPLFAIFEAAPDTINTYNNGRSRDSDVDVGTITINQRPERTVTGEVLTTTTADIGRMMLADVVLAQQGLNARLPRNTSALTLLNMSSLPPA